MTGSFPTRQHWRSHAACRDTDPETFFPAAEGGQAFERQVSEAKVICARYPVRRSASCGHLRSLHRLTLEAPDAPAPPSSNARHAVSGNPGSSSASVREPQRGRS
jgi:hypothetical protein